MTRLNTEIVKALPAPERGNKVSFFAGAIVQGLPAPRGFGIRVTASGAKSFILDYRLRGRQYRFTIGSFPDWPPLRAVSEARKLRQRVDRGENPLEDRSPPASITTVSDVLDNFMKRHVRAPARPLRTADEYESVFRRLVRPRIGKVGIYELRRSHVAQMLDKIEDENGPVMADRTRAYFRKALSWYAERDDQFNLNAAIVRVAPRANSMERARTRTLSDEEIRDIWPQLEEAGTFGVLVKMLLLTAQRRNEVAQMSRNELGANGVWVIPAERYKAKRPNFVPLSKAAMAIVQTQPEIAECDYVFAGRTKQTPFSGFAKGKATLDKAVAGARGGEPLPNWTLHDLRRTAKTLMVRAGVRPDISERVLGHVIAGVEGTYDRYSYLDEKRDALEKLAATVEQILMPPSKNVVPRDKRQQEARS